MSKAKFFFDKYGIRFGVAFLGAVGFQAIQGDWDGFVGGCIVTGLVVAASYPVEEWFKKASA